MGVTNRRPNSNSELIPHMEMRFLACVTRVPSREPYQTVSTVNFLLGIMRTDLWSQGIQPQENLKIQFGENYFVLGLLARDIANHSFEHTFDPGLKPLE